MILNGLKTFIYMHSNNYKYLRIINYKISKQFYENLYNGF